MVCQSGGTTKPKHSLGLGMLIIGTCSFENTLGHPGYRDRIPNGALLGGVVPGGLVSNSMGIWTFSFSQGLVMRELPNQLVSGELAG